MLKLSKEKKEKMEKLSTPDGIINALAIDQRGALKKMIQALGTEPTHEIIEEFKNMVSQKLTPYTSSILLDPEYGLTAANKRDKKTGLLLAYEKSGYDATVAGRLPALLKDWSVLRLKNENADAVKFLLYYDTDEDWQINHLKHVFIERLGSECAAEEIPFYLELLSYDAQNNDTSSKEYAKVKPHKVIEMMKEFSQPQYQVDVLKVEVPVNMQFVEGYGNKEAVYTKEEAKTYFKEQSQATDLPFIFLSAGVSTQLFQETLVLAKEANSAFNGVLCGRATWKDGVAAFIQDGEKGAFDWLKTQGKENVETLNQVVKQTATSWHEKDEVE